MLMNIKETLRNSTDLARNNFQLFIPPVAAALIAGAIDLLGSAIAGQRTVAMDASAGTIDAIASTFSGQALWVTMLFGALSMIVVLLGHGMTIAIAHQVADGHKGSLSEAYSTVRARFIPLLIAAAITGILVGIGTALFLLPGLIIGFLLMFSFVAVMAGGHEAFAALKRSFEIVTHNLGESLILFLVLLAVGVLFGVVSAMLVLIPYVGPLLSLILSGIYVGVASVVVLLAYKTFDSLPSAGSAETGRANTQQ